MKRILLAMFLLTTISFSQTVVQTPQGGTGTKTPPAAGQILVGNASGLAYSPQTLTGSCTLSFTGVISCTGLSTWNSITNGTQTGSGASQINTLPGAFFAKNIGSMGPYYDVSQFGALGQFTAVAITGTLSIGGSTITVPSGASWAIGEGILIPGAGPSASYLVTSITNISGNVLTLAATASTAVTGVTVYEDDTAAIQAASDACWAGGLGGGTVGFPGGNVIYYISSTINAHLGCTFAAYGSQNISPVQIQWNGPATGTVYNITAVAVTSNVATITATNSLVAGQWVILQGLQTGPGRTLNNFVAQVSATGLSGSSFQLVLPAAVANAGTTSDTGTATYTSVMLAFGSTTITNAGYHVTTDGLLLKPRPPLYLTANQPGIGILRQNRVDSGTAMYRTWIQEMVYFGIDFAGGGINTSIDDSFRVDSFGLAGIYWRVGGADNFSISRGTLTQFRNGEGAFIMLDGQQCLATSTFVRLSIRNGDLENNFTAAAGMGDVTMLDCPANHTATQFFINEEGVEEGSNSNPAFSMIPANDAALNLTIVNSQMNGGGTANRWYGLPGFARHDMTGTQGWMSLFAWNGAETSAAAGPYGGGQSINQLPGDTNIDQLYQYGIQASTYLYSDTAFAALANGTNLYAGQILAPPASWVGSNGKRYAVDVVYQRGTTGTPNGGATTCSAPGGNNLLTCTSATDLSNGQSLILPVCGQRLINQIDATNPTAVIVTGTGNWTACTSQVLSYVAPVLGLEIQFPTKSAAAPTNLAWSQGDMEQNSGAVANGIAEWVNVAAGTPGTWAGVPLGDTSGKIAASQIQAASKQGTDTNLLTAGTVSGTGSPLCTDTNGGATTVGCGGSSAPGVPTWMLNTSSGVDGSYEFSSTGSCTGSPTHCFTSCTPAAPCLVSGEFYATNFTIDSGAAIKVSFTAFAGLATIHATGLVTLNGTVYANGLQNVFGVNKGIGGSTGGGGGGGTLIGAAAPVTYPSLSQFVTSTVGGTAGAASSGNAGNGVTLTGSFQRTWVNSGEGNDGTFISGTAGGAGGSSGGAGGQPGSGFTIISASFSGTGGAIDVSGAPGQPPTASNEGAGGGGGGGVITIYSQVAVTNWPSLYIAPGAGITTSAGSLTVPLVVGEGGSCTTEPQATVAVAAGAFSGVATVVAAGAGCGTGTGMIWSFEGGGGTPGTAVFNPTFSGGALASATVTPGTSSGYTAATFTGVGNGGQGGSGYSVGCVNNTCTFPAP